eukprot:TRINITY_DN11124_c0_g1_i7.p1 TRINITY_DN11124_c0_g1~~TRINITY_DN11124_c0_g1_i7.p1  ORF type:complete len:230 (+),score=53.60 TRINITY_DN11124_c0_g1_i7:103-792(+)
MGNQMNQKLKNYNQKIKLTNRIKLITKKQVYQNKLSMKMKCQQKNGTKKNCQQMKKNKNKNKKKQQLLQELALLKDQLHSKESTDQDPLNPETKKLQEQNKQLSQEIQKLTSEIAFYEQKEGDIDELNDENTNLREEIEELTLQNKVLEQSLTKSKIGADMNELIKENSELTVRNQQLKAKQKEYVIVKEQYDQVVKELMTSQQKIGELFNSALEIGGNELLSKLTQSM